MNSDLFSYLAQERALNAVSVNDALVVAMDRQPKPKVGDGNGNKEDIHRPHEVNPITYEESDGKKTDKSDEIAPIDDASKHYNEKSSVKDTDVNESSAKKYLSRINKTGTKPSKKDVCFDDVADEVDLNDVMSIQEAFDLYRKEDTPPCDIEDILEEEKFKSGDTNNGEKTIRLDFIMPAVENDDEADTIRQYLEDFLERIGVDEPYDEVNCELTDDGRGGSDCEVSVVHRVEED